MSPLVSVETVIKDRQSDYCLALRQSDASADAAPFVSFMLEAIYSAPVSALGKNLDASPAADMDKSSGKILALIQVKPDITAPELAGQLGISVRAVEKHLANLKAAGKLRRVGGAKGGYWACV